MKKTTLHKITIPILLVLILNQACTALFREKIGFAVFQWLHARAGLLLIGMIAVHLVLNFGWIKANFFSK